MSPTGCGDNSCPYSTKRGMGTNGGCTCDRCPECGANMLPGLPWAKHRKWCQQQEWIPEHHKQEAVK